MPNSRSRASHKLHRLTDFLRGRRAKQARRRRHRVMGESVSGLECLEPRRLLATASITAFKDATLYESPDGDLANGSGDHIFAGRVSNNGNNMLRRGLMAFDLESAGIPAGATITEATLNLSVSRARTAAPDTVMALHTVSKDWGEGVSDAMGEEGQGIASTRNDATWQHTFWNFQMWENLGGDFNPQPSATATVGTVGTTATWTSPQLAADVQSWLDNPTTNFGWMLLGDEETDGSTRRFWSSDSLSGLNPRLDITFELATLTLNVNDIVISENGGQTMATVSRNRTAGDLSVTLFSDDTSEATLIDTIQIPDGQDISAPFVINAVDDDILDGPQGVNLTATAPGHVAGNQLLVVSDFEPLTISIADGAIGENGGSTTGIVTRTDGTLPVTVDLITDDGSEASVVSSIQLAAGETTSAPFNIDAVDDALLDGTQLVSVTASATGYEPDSASLNVTDFEELTVTIADTSIAETGGSTTATVTRTDPTGSLTVNLLSEDTTEATVVASVVIPDGQTQSPAFNIDAVNDGTLDGTETVTISATAPGYQPGADTLLVTDFGPLVVAIDADSLSEAGGTTTAQVTRNDTTTGDLMVTITSSDDTEATVVASVMIPDGQATSAPFEITSVDDSLLDGTQTVTITAAADGHGPGTDTLDITDFEELVVTIDVDSLPENNVSTTGTITRSGTVGNLTVTLSVDDPTAATVAASVTIPDGASVSPPFAISTVDDAVLDGTQTATITANATGYEPGSDSVDVTDYEELTLAIEAAAISENGGATTATVTRTDTTGELTVNLVSGDEGEATVAATVVIPDGQATSPAFAIDAVDDDVLDGTQVVTLTASAAGYVNANETLEVSDFELLSVAIDPASISENGGSATATVTRLDSSGELVVTLASDGIDEATVPATVVIPGGELSAEFTVSAVDDAFVDGTQTVTITAEADGYEPTSANINVEDFEALLVTLSSSEIEENGGFVTATVRRPGNSGDLVVDLASSDTGEATVLPTVTIPNGLRSRTFLVRAVDDSELDGNQTVTVTASAAGYVAGSVDATVVDDDTVSITIEPVQDTTLFENATGAVSNGAGDYLFSGRTNQSEDNLRRALVQFDLSVLGLPAGSTITAASFDLTVSQGQPTPQSTSLHRVTTAWGEGASDADGGEGSGADAATGDATWVHTFFDTQQWTTPGGDFDATASATADVGAVGTTASWSSAGLIADVQRWVEFPEENYGWIVVGNEGEARSSKRFDSRERPGGDAPQLTITYAAPTENIQLTVVDSTISENGGSTEVIVARSGDTSESLIVNLSSADVSEAAVPDSITIPSGLASASFFVTAVDDDILDGTVATTVEGRATGFSPGTATVNVTDFEPLTINIDADFISESGGSTTATVTRVGTAGDLVVNLASGDLTELTVIGPITIPDGQAVSDPFTINAVNDAVQDGSQTASVIVSADGYESGSDELDVRDDDTTQVELAGDTLNITGSDERLDNLTLRIVGTDLAISDPFNSLTTIGFGAPPIVANELFVPLSFFPGGLNISGRGQSDSVTIDESIDNATLALLSINGGPGSDTVVVEGAGKSLDLSQLTSVDQVDLDGSGENQLTLDVASVLQNIVNGIAIRAGLDDVVDFGDGWRVSGTTVFGGDFYRVLSQGNAQFLLSGPSNWQNPIDVFDLNNDGFISATADVLPGINELNFPSIVTSNGALPVTPATDQLNASGPFYDTDGDGFLSPADILARINRLLDISAGTLEGEGEGPISRALNLDPADLEDAGHDVVTPLTVSVVAPLDSTTDANDFRPASDQETGGSAEREYATAVDEAFSELDDLDLLDGGLL